MTKAGALALAASLLFALLAPPRAATQVLSPGTLSTVHESLEGDDKCLDCHSSGKRVDPQQCLECHADIGRQRQKSSGLHGREYRDRACGECHVEHRGAQHELVRWPGGSQAKFDHRLAGWELAGAHARVACAKCHTAKNARGAATFLGLGTSCTSCHEDPHDKRLGTSCTTCHDERSWKSTTLTAFDHSLARFPLRGKHQDVDCKSCHGTPPKTKYHPLAFEACTSCHEDPHQDRFRGSCTNCHVETSWSQIDMQRASHPGLSLSGGHSSVKCASCHDRGLDRAPSKGGRCVSCHAPIHEAPFGNDCAHCHKRIDWLGVPDALSLEVHGKTAFPLRGEHRQVACEQCHLPKLPLERRFRKLQFARCLDCHADAHQGQFKAREGGDCAGCHDEHGFVPTRFGIEAHGLTDFPLIGRHTAVACLGCHEHARASTTAVQSSKSGRGAAAEAPRLDWQLESPRCADCHENPHDDQFAKEMADGGCAHCHTPNAWNLPSIDHSRWPLTGAHALAQCASCHEAEGASASYRGAPRECAGCHEDPHAGQFRLQDPRVQCDQCHETKTFSIATFDHAASARYALDGAHRKVACSGCHHSETLRNGATAIRYRLGYKACADCHRDPHTPGAP